jgi:hypothetical protein
MQILVRIEVVGGMPQPYKPDTYCFVLPRVGEIQKYYYDAGLGKELGIAQGSVQYVVHPPEASEERIILVLGYHS